MKILLVAHLFLPDYFSGTEILTLHTALELKLRGHEVQVLAGFPATTAMADSERFDHYQYDGIPVTRFKHAHSPMGGQGNVVEQEYNNLLVAEHFKRLIDEFQPDVVHFFHLMRISASVVDVCWQRHIPTVLTPTDFWLICPMCQLRLPDGGMCSGPDLLGSNCVRHLVALKMPRLASGFIDRLPRVVVAGLVRVAGLAPVKYLGPARLVAALSRRKKFLQIRLKRIDRVLVPTRIMLQTLQRHGLSPKQVRYCPYGIRLPNLTARARQLPGPLRLGMIGLMEHKGAHVLLDAVRVLPDLELAVKIYGRPSDFPSYARRLRHLADGDRRVEFCGSFPNDQIGSILSQLDVLVVPSVWFENAPLVIHSAQAAGVPVIGSDVSGIAELITHEENGFLFPPGDAARLAEIIAALACDRAQLTRLSERARMPKTIATYTDELLAVYAELVRDKKAAA